MLLSTRVLGAAVTAYVICLAGANNPVLIQGLNAPISVTWDTFGNVFVAEKAGVVKGISGWVGNPTNVVLDITAQVDCHGDHGLTSILWDSGFLYATYMKQTAEWGCCGCTDSGQDPGSRNWSSILGCNIYGRVSRWRVTQTGAVTGAEQVLMDTQFPDSHGRSACVQFSTHSTPTCIIASGDGAFYVSMGDGAAFTMPDFGELGTTAGPPPVNQGGCNDNYPYLGAFRCQDPQRLNGKILRLDPAANFDYTVVSRGHRNPFRLSLFGTELLESETGWYTYEEINLIKPGLNYGWPCWEGPIHTPEYDWSSGPGSQGPGGIMCSAINMTLPVYSYAHPVPPIIQWSGNVMSISGLAALGSRIYYNDFTVGVIRSIDASSFSDDVLVASGVYPVELKVNPNGDLVYVDFRFGYVGAVNLSLSAAAPSPPAGAAASVALEYSSTTWVPGSVISASAATNLNNSREGILFYYTVVYITGCNVNGPNTCDVTALISNVPGGSADFTISTPPAPGVIETTVTVALAGEPIAARNTKQISSPGVPLCPCTGARSTASPPSPSSAASPSASISPSTQGPAVVDGKGFAQDAPLSQPVLIGVIAIGAVLALVVVVVGISLYSKKRASHARGAAAVAGAAATTPTAMGRGASTAAAPTRLDTLPASPTASALAQAGSARHRRVASVQAMWSPRA